MKYIFIVLSVIIGIIIGMFIPRNDGAEEDYEEPYAVIDIDDFFIPELTWGDISAIGSPLIERDIIGIRINDLNWKLVGCGDPDHLPEHDILILNDASTLETPPKELKDWMKRNSGTLTSISFGESINFSTVTWLCELFEKHNFKCGLSTYTNSSDSIMIDRFWADDKWKPKMITEPNQILDPTWTTPVLKAKSVSQAGQD
jgi:hypothetical protein